MNRRWRRALRPLALVLTVGLAGCSVLGSEDDLAAEPVPTAAPTDGTDPALADFYSQQISWRECRVKLECAEIEVPLDYADPAGEKITLAMLKVPAGDADKRVGSLVVNPGGPGVSAIDYAANAKAYFGQPLREVFDIVGFDPRGVAASTPLDCLSDEDLDAYVAFDPDPDTAEESRQAGELFAAFGEGCLERSGDLARHISTEETARDLDVVRAVLGQEQLVYFGASYGTLLGATYADLFPERAGRLVLDGAVDPSSSIVDLNLVQARGFETALRAYVQECVDGGDCFLGSTADAGLETIQAFLAEVDQKPIAVGDRELAEGHAVLGIWAPLYERTFWPALDKALGDALEGDARTLLAFSDAYASRGPEGYTNNSLEALLAINCLDRDEWVSPRRQRALAPRFEEASATFGRLFNASLSGCRDWPVHTGKGPETLEAKGADPILVVGTSRDPATPLEWAEGLAGQLDSGVLVRRDGDGHTGYGAGNECVDDIVEKFLVSGEAPTADVDC